MEYEILVSVIAQTLGIPRESVRPQSSFVDDLGADSLEIFHIITRLEEEFDVEVDVEYAREVVNVADAARLIKDTIAQ